MTTTPTHEPNSTKYFNEATKQLGSWNFLGAGCNASLGALFGTTETLADMVGVFLSRASKPLIAQLSDDAPSTMTSLKDSLSSLLQTQLSSKVVATSYFDTIRFYVNAGKPEYLNRALSADETAILEEGIKTLGLSLFQITPTKRSLSAFQMALLELKKYASNERNSQPHAIKRHELLSHIETCISIDTPSHSEVTINKRQRASLHYIAHALVKFQEEMPSLACCERALRTLEDLTTSTEETLSFSDETKNQILLLNDLIHSGVTERAGLLPKVVHHLKREIQHSTKGIVAVANEALFNRGSATSVCKRAQPNYKKDPSLLCLQKVLRLFADRSLSKEEQRRQLEVALDKYDIETKVGIFRLIAKEKGRDVFWAKKHFNENEELFLTAFSHAHHQKICGRSGGRQSLYFLHIYESAQEKPPLGDDKDKIRWGMGNWHRFPLQSIIAYAIAVSQSATTSKNAKRVAHAATKPERENAPAGSVGSADTVCGGVFGAAMFFIQNAPKLLAEFGLESVAGVVRHQLETRVTNFIRGYRDIDQTHRTTILSAISTGIRALEMAQITGSTEGYLDALKKVAAELGQFDILFNGVSIIPSFDESDDTDEIAEIEAQRITQAEKHIPAKPQDIKLPHERVTTAKESFKDLAVMYATYVYVFGVRCGAKNKVKDIEDSIREALARKEAQQGHPFSPREYREAFSNHRAERFDEIVKAEEDTGLEEVMKAVGKVEDEEQRMSAFKKILCNEIDQRKDLLWINKIWFKWVTIPFCLHIIPMFTGKAIDDLFGKIQTYLHNASKQEDGSPATIVDPQITQELTNFFAKYRMGINTWAKSSVGRSKDEALEQFMLRKQQNNGWGADEVYNELTTLLIKNFMPGASFWSKGIIKQVAAKIDPIRLLSNTASNSLYKKAYMPTLNRLLLRQLKEAWKLLNTTRKDMETEKSLRLAARIVDNPTAPRREVFDHLKKAWAHLRGKLLEGDSRIKPYDAELKSLEEHFDESRARGFIRPGVYNERLKVFQRNLKIIHEEFNTESVSGKYPDKAKAKVAELIFQTNSVLEKHPHYDPRRAQRAGLIDTAFIEPVIDSVTELVLGSCEPLLKKDFLETQLATALEATNETMRYNKPSDIEFSNHTDADIESEVDRHVKMITENVVLTIMDKVATVLHESKLQEMKEMIDWMKITFLTGTGLHCKTPTPQKNVTLEWEHSLNDFAETRDTKKLDVINTSLLSLLEEFDKKRRELRDTQLSPQTKKKLSHIRNAIVTSLHRFQDSLEPLFVGGDSRGRMERLIRQTREQLQTIRELVEGIDYPPILDADVFGLKSPHSITTKWIKSFINFELQKRTKEALRFVQDEVVFKSAIHHTAVALVKIFSDPADVRKRNQWVEDLPGS